MGCQTILALCVAGLLCGAYGEFRSSIQYSTFVSCVLREHAEKVHTLVLPTHHDRWMPRSHPGVRTFTFSLVDSLSMSWTVVYVHSLGSSELQFHVCHIDQL